MQATAKQGSYAGVITGTSWQPFGQSATRENPSGPAPLRPLSRQEIGEVPLTVRRDSPKGAVIIPARQRVVWRRTNTELT